MNMEEETQKTYTKMFGSDRNVFDIDVKSKIDTGGTLDETPNVLADTKFDGLLSVGKAMNVKTKKTQKENKSVNTHQMFNNKISSFDKNMSSMLSFGNKKNNFNVGNFISGSSKNIKKDFNVGNFLSMSTKSKNNFNVDKYVGGVEKQGWNRLKMQNNLNMFGDKDRDGVKNIFDCNPFDSSKQAEIHRVLGQSTRKVETYDVPIEERPVEVYDVERQPVQAEEPQVQQVQAEEPQQPSRFASGIKTLLIGTGLMKTEQQKIEEREYQKAMKEAEHKAKVQVYREIASGKTRGLYSGQLKKQRAIASRTQQPLYKRDVVEIREGLSRGAMEVTGSKAQGFDVSKFMGVGTSGYGIRMMAGGGRQLEQQPQQQIQQQTMPSQQQQEQQPISEPTASQPTSPQPQPGMVWSVKSKKWVRYTRKPYKQIYRQQY